ncbi:3'-5' exoribonuclease [Streptomyces sp. SID8381]|uniref:3'-5' exoribonuclease n=1 Tax=unclassified Streptomyces TaxID=2593676 RepID=UPI000367BAD1|nr:MULTISPECIES: 3'-5' exoribonuclease [unclassified Streptomyces]MYX26839.1 3'-5' exoribonuclease [Streptomyces sp. SID8381]
MTRMLAVYVRPAGGTELDRLMNPAPLACWWWPKGSTWNRTHDLGLMGVGDVLLIATGILPRRPETTRQPAYELVRLARITDVETTEQGTAVRLHQTHAFTNGQLRLGPAVNSAMEASRDDGCTPHFVNVGFDMGLLVPGWKQENHPLPDRLRFSRRIYLDLEFVPAITSLRGTVSIGLHDDAGQDYYAVNADMSVAAVRAHPFLREHVWPYLPLTADGELDRSHRSVKTEHEIRSDLEAYFGGDGRRDKILYANHGAQDVLRLHAFWGHDWNRMPSVIPTWAEDLKALRVRAGDPPMPKQKSTEHHALDDARHNRAMHEALLALGTG